MAKLEEVMPAYRRGDKIRMKDWPEDRFCQKDNPNSIKPFGNNLHEDDWEVVETLHTFAEMIAHLESGGKARRKLWIRPECFYYLEKDEIRNQDHCDADITYREYIATDWILL